MRQEKDSTISGKGKYLKREDRMRIERLLKRNRLKGLLKRYGILSLRAKAFCYCVEILSLRAKAKQSLTSFQKDCFGRFSPSQ